MKRLKRQADRPRENFKEVEYLLKLSLECDNFEGDAINDLQKFKEWVVNTFTKWDNSILEYFLYQYNLLNNSDDKKYKLNFKVENILKDDTSQELRPMVEDKIDDKSNDNK